jgi:Rad3-related DNA helicase
VQFLIRGDGNLILIHCGGRFAAERCSDPEPLIRSTFAKINALLAMSATCSNSENICSLGVLPP